MMVPKYKVGDVLKDKEKKLLYLVVDVMPEKYHLLVFGVIKEYTIDSQTVENLTHKLKE